MSNWTDFYISTQDIKSVTFEQVCMSTRNIMNETALKACTPSQIAANATNVHAYSRTELPIYEYRDKSSNLRISVLITLNIPNGKLNEKSIYMKGTVLPRQRDYVAESVNACDSVLRLCL
jgi:hypothetical protein